MTDDRLAYSVAEVAAMLGVSRWNVGAMTRPGPNGEPARLPTLPGVSPKRIPAWALDDLLGVYHATDDQPDREAATEAPAPRRGHRRVAQGSLAGEAVGGGGPLGRRGGPTSGDVVVRRVTRGG